MRNRLEGGTAAVYAAQLVYHNTCLVEPEDTTMKRARASSGQTSLDSLWKKTKVAAENCMLKTIYHQN